MAYLTYNGKIVSDKKVALSPLNRSFRYGDGLFESVRMLNGKIPFLAGHLERLKKGMEVLKIEAPGYFTEKYFERQIRQLAAKNKIKHNARVKMIVWREADGLYTPRTNKAGWLMEIFPMKNSGFVLNRKGFRVDVFDGVKKNCDVLSNYKTNNALPFILASLFAKQKKLDDALILNVHGRVCEATSSNVFVWTAPVLTTPPLSEGCVGGVMRKSIIRIARQNNISVKERKLTVKELLKADEIFITNAVAGIEWVGKLKSRNLTYHIAHLLNACLNDYCRSFIPKKV